MKTKVLIVQKAFSNYRKGFFDKLNEKYEFLLLHSKTNTGVKEIKNIYSQEIKSIKYFKNPTNIYLCIFPNIKRFKPNIVIHEFTPSIISIYLLFLLRRFYNYKIILWGHGFNRSKKLSKNTLVYLLRKFLIIHADAVVFYGNKNKEILDEFIPSNKYFVANNSLDTNELNRIFKSFEKIGKQKIKSELKIKNNYNLIFIGRLLEDKLLTDIFFEVVKSVQSKLNDVGVLIIGEGPEKDRIERHVLNKKLKDIKVLGGIHDNMHSGKYLYISDLLLMPGYVGLAVNHALSFLIPVVTFREGKYGPFHSPEIEYVIHERTGFLIEPFDVDMMSDTIVKYLLNEEIQRKMKQEITLCLKNVCNIENMYKGFDKAINYCLETNAK